MSYHETESPRKLFKAGDVMRMGETGAFMDAVILGFDANGYASLSRPYLYVNGEGTTCPTSLVGFELIDRVSEDSLEKFWKRVGIGRTV